MSTLRAAVVFAGGVLTGLLYMPRAPTLPVATAHAAPAVASPKPSPNVIASRALASTVYLHGGTFYGAGVVIDAKGHVITCDHVVEGREQMDASFDGDAVTIPAKVVARASDVDLALLELVGGLPRGRVPLTVASVADVTMGDTVFAMGAPRKMRFSFGHGVVSYVGRPFDGTYYVQTDLAANGGSSGGPVMNDRGELIGLAAFILHDSEGLTFAVPIDYAWERFKEELGRDARDDRRFRSWLDVQSRAVAPKT